MTNVPPPVGRTAFAACIAPPIFQVNRCGSAENTRWTKMIAPAVPTIWIPAAVSTQPGDALPIAERTPLKPGSRPTTPITTATRTARTSPPRISLRLTPVRVGAGCDSVEAASAAAGS
jgi:hypothetical protein